MYNDTVSPEVSCLLDHYIKAGLLTLLPWRFDMVSQKEIRTEGLFAALNDCLYRFLSSSSPYLSLSSSLSSGFCN